MCFCATPGRQNVLTSGGRLLGKFLPHHFAFAWEAVSFVDSTFIKDELVKHFATALAISLKKKKRYKSTSAGTSGNYVPTLMLLTALNFKYLMELSDLWKPLSPHGEQKFVTYS